MATPHTVGVAALYLETHKTASPAAVRDALYNATSKGVVTSSSTTNNHLLYSLFPGGGGRLRPRQFSGSPTSGVAPLVVQFTDSSTGSPTSWSWNFGDGGTATTQSPSHTYTAAGAYTVSLTATNASGSDPEVKTNYISVSAPTPTRTDTDTDTDTDGNTDADADARHDYAQRACIQGQGKSDCRPHMGRRQRDQRGRLPEWRLLGHNRERQFPDRRDRRQGHRHLHLQGVPGRIDDDLLTGA